MGMAIENRARLRRRRRAEAHRPRSGQRTNRRHTGAARRCDEWIRNSNWRDLSTIQSRTVRSTSSHTTV